MVITKNQEHTFNSVDEVDQFLESQKILKLTKEVDNMNKPMSIREIEFIVYNFPKRKSSVPDISNGEFYQTFEERITPILQQYFPGN